MQRSVSNVIKSQASLQEKNKSKSKSKTNTSGDVGNASKISVKASQADNFNDGKPNRTLL